MNSHELIAHLDMQVGRAKENYGRLSSAVELLIGNPPRPEEEENDRKDTEVQLGGVLKEIERLSYQLAMVNSLHDDLLERLVTVTPQDGPVGAQVKAIGSLR